MRYTVLTAAALLLGIAIARADATAAIVINELDTDQPTGFDVAEFVELKNTGTVPVNLAGWTLEMVNGTTGSPSVYRTVTLPTATIAPGGYFVVSFGSAYPWWTDFQANTLNSSIHNGPSDAIVLRDPNNAITDALSYEGSCGPPWQEGVGTPLSDSDVTPYVGYSRWPDGADTNDNSADFVIRCITPGAPNSASGGGCGQAVRARTSTWGTLKTLHR